MKIAKHNQLRFEIIEHPGFGFYLNVYDGERCIADYVQDNEASCMRQALEEYGVDFESWQEVSRE